MIKFLFSITISITSFISFSQNLNSLSFGSDNALDIMTWNLETFPKAGQNTMDSISKIVLALDMDVIAVQEINDTSAFSNMMSGINGYDGFARLNYLVGLGFIYKTATVQINDLYEIYTAPQYWNNFPRAPIVMDMNFMNQRYILIVNHLKCCGDGIIDLGNTNDEENRRLEAMNLLKNYIDLHFSNVKTILLGDLNDEITDPLNTNVFSQIINDPAHYSFADSSIAYGTAANWSYPTWPSHLDHLIVSDELFYDLNHGGSFVQTLKPEQYISNGWPSYELLISDHRPVAMKIFPTEVLQTNEIMLPETSLVIFPNPSNGNVNFICSCKETNLNLSIYTSNGQLVYSAQMSSNTIWNTENVKPGVYFVTLNGNNEIIERKKLLLF